LLKIPIYLNLYYNFLSLITIAPSPPSFLSASSIEEIYLEISISDLINAGTEYLSLLKSFDA